MGGGLRWLRQGCMTACVPSFCQHLLLPAVVPPLQHLALTVSIVCAMRKVRFVLSCLSSLMFDVKGQHSVQTRTLPFGAEMDLVFKHSQGNGDTALYQIYMAPITMVVGLVSGLIGGFIGIHSLSPMCASSRLFVICSLAVRAPGALDIHTYMHTYIPTYMHAYIHTYIRTYIHT
jgi:hypothetical protein